MIHNFGAINVKPSGSFWAKGTFLLYLDMGQNFPSFAPELRFVTPILHPNVTSQGRVCHSILDRVTLVHAYLKM